MCNDSPAICGDFLCYRRHGSSRSSSFSSTTYETTTSDYSYEAKLVAPREKSWQDLQACDGCPAKRSTISTKCHITAQPPQALSRRGSGLAWRWRGVSIVPAAERGSQPDPASLPRCAPPRDSAFTIIFRHSLLIKGHGTLIGVVCLSVFFLKLEFWKVVHFPTLRTKLRSKSYH